MVVKPGVATMSTLLFVTAFVIGPSSTTANHESAGGCEEQDAGWNWGEEAGVACDFGCNSGYFLHALGSVDEQGKDGRYVRASASCGGAGANCFGQTGWCHGSSNPTTTQTGGSLALGACQASGWGGSYTNIRVHCWLEEDQTGGSGGGSGGESGGGSSGGGSGGGSPRDTLTDILSAVQSSTQSNSAFVAPIDGMTSLASLAMIEDQPAAWVCQVGHVCVQVEPICTILPSQDDAFWECTISAKRV